jgi:recombination DNA repair RAD52 pathway protein
MGNCLYDKQYTSEIVKIKVPPVRDSPSASRKYIDVVV